MIATQVVMRNSDETFLRFLALIGRETWKREIDSIDKSQQQYPFVGAYRRDQYQLIHELERYAEIHASNGAVSERDIVARKLDYAVDFMTRTLSLVDMCDGDSQKNFVARVKGALRDLRALRGLELEMNTASHYTNLGSRVRWCELDDYTQEASTYDLLVENTQIGGLEIECKSFMEDTGQEIGRESAREVWDALVKVMPQVLENLSVGLGVSISVRGRFDSVLKSATQRAMLANRMLPDLSRVAGAEDIASTISAEYLDGVTVRIQQFDSLHLADLDLRDRTFGAQQSSRRIFGQLTNTTWSDGTTFFCEPSRRGGGAVIAALRSEEKDQFVEKVTRTAKAAAKRQLTGQRPGLLVLGLPVSSDELAQSSRLRLDAIAKRVFASEGCQHVTGVWFVAQSRPLSLGFRSRQMGSTIYRCMREDFVG
jgi:hypothetical protein